MSKRQNSIDDVVEVVCVYSVCIYFLLFFQSNAMLPESLRNSDKRRNGPDFLNDSKKRKIEDKDSSHYVRHQPVCVCVCGQDFTCSFKQMGGKLYLIIFENKNFGRPPSVLINLGRTLLKQNLCLCVDMGSVKKPQTSRQSGENTNHHRMFRR